MAYDRYDTRGGSRERWRSDDRFDRDRDFERGQHGRDERGFFERAGDEIASWFGSDDGRSSGGDRRPSGWGGGDERREWERGERQRGGWRGQGPDRDWDRGRDVSRERGFDRDRDWERGRRFEDERGGMMSSRGYRGTSGETGTGFSPWGGGQRPEHSEWQERSQSQRDRSYRPMTGDYGRTERDRDHGGGGFDEPRDRDPYRRTSFAGSMEHHDPHYRSWRERQISELDRDYDDYRREHQSKFESDFGSWREKRMQKRGLLGQVREHMDVVGSDGEHVGTVDRTAGDRIILTKGDAESGGAHHSLACTEIDRIEGDKVMLSLPADQARQRWRDEDRERGLFERGNRGEEDRDAGPGILDRSFSGTYR